MTQALFPVQQEYARAVAALTAAKIITILPQSKRLGVIGIDDKEYPLPTQEQVAELFERNKQLVAKKVSQGFDRLELTPMALPIATFTDLLTTAIIQHAAAGGIYQQKKSPTDPSLLVRVNTTKHVWIWETLRLAFNAHELVYFPQEYSTTPGGQTKHEVINNTSLCAVPGWSVGLVESLPFMPHQGHGQILNGRKQLEIGCSPREYLQALQADEYCGETGKTLEDFMTKFLTRLATTQEVSHDVNDGNALWCLGQYLKIPYAQVVPTGRWHRNIGRVRLDMHRTGNKLCAKNFGCATTVRLSA